MFCFSSSSFARCNFWKKNKRSSRYVTRDDLDAKHAKCVTKGATKEEAAYKHDMKRASTYDDQNRGTIRVKVVMTKKEAMLLFSKCDCGGSLSFENVAKELTKIPANRVSLVQPSSPNREVIMLESIPEEP